MPEVILRQVREEVNTFTFDLEPMDYHLAGLDSLTDAQMNYLFEKYCHDKDGYYKNLSDSYGDSEKLILYDIR